MEILNIKQNMSTYKPLFNIFQFQSICLRAASLRTHFYCVFVTIVIHLSWFRGGRCVSIHISCYFLLNIHHFSFYPPLIDYLYFDFINFLSTLYI